MRKRTIINISDMEKRWLMNYEDARYFDEAVRRGIVCLKAPQSSASYQRIVH
jgi:hypothetical protein